MNGAQDHELPRLDHSRRQLEAVPGLLVDSGSRLAILHFSERERSDLGHVVVSTCLRSREKRREMRPQAVQVAVPL